MLQESKSFYVKSERVLDRKQSLPLPHCNSSGNSNRLPPQHYIRTPMLGPPHRMREQHQLPIGSNSAAYLHPAGIDDPAYARRNKEVWNATLPVEKRGLSIRKDNPLPFVNVTAVKRFLSRPEETVFHLRKATSKFPLPATRVASSSAPPPPPPPPPQQQQQPQQSSKKLKSRITFAEVIPCICQSQNTPPELPHRMSRMRASPPPPIPPKSPALNAKLRLLSQQSLQQQSHPHPPPAEPVLKETHPHIQPPQVPSISSFI